jgi:REP element-mobilizing transposase RayT
MHSPGGAKVSHTYVQNNLHVIFSTKERQKQISKVLQPELWSYMAGICRNNGILVFAIGGMEEHAHMFVHIPATLSIAKAMQTVKAYSSKWVRETNRRFAWQEGYAALSVSASNRAAVINYVQNQEKQHAKMSFEDEFLKLLKKHQIHYDPKYHSCPN